MFDSSALCAVARLQHFTRAAEELYIAQPALSQQIRQLEEDLGVQLFERSSRRVRLTAAGLALVERAERILLDMERIRGEMGEIAGSLRGQLAIGALPTVAERQLPALIGQFHQQHPGIELRLVEDHSEQLLTLVSSGLLDLAFTHISRMHDAQLIHFPIMFPAEIVTVQLYTDDLVAIVAPQHPWTQQAAITFQMLANEPLIVFKPGSSIRALLMRLQNATMWSCICASRSAAPRPPARSPPPGWGGDLAAIRGAGRRAAGCGRRRVRLAEA